MITQKTINDLSYEIIGSAIEVQKRMGRGLLESVYQSCMEKELSLRGICFQKELNIPVLYKGTLLDIHFRCDLFVENYIVVELKAVQEMNSLFHAQLLTYMKILEAPKGILINFNSVNIFREGQKTFVNEYFACLPER